MVEVSQVIRPRVCCREVVGALRIVQEVEGLGHSTMGILGHNTKVAMLPYMEREGAEATKGEGPEDGIITSMVEEEAGLAMWVVAWTLEMLPWLQAHLVLVWAKLAHQSPRSLDTSEEWVWDRRDQARGWHLMVGTALSSSP